MIELERHIEILLLSNDCVIVPGLGGFMAHHVEARYDASDGMFLPPLRTLGFNPQLQLNDSLLVQSYIEAYDISYPEALRRIESEVAELKQHLVNEGLYELNDIGVLSVNEDGNYVFEPNEAGILTPTLYGLGTFQMLPLSNDKADERKPSRSQLRSKVPVAEADHDADNQEKAITIPMRWLRNTAAVAAAIIAFFLLSTPVGQYDGDTLMQQSSILPVDRKVAPAEKPVAKTIKTVSRDSVKSVATTPKAATPKKEVEAKDEYAIVLASQIKKSNAEYFVDQLHKNGFSEARIYISNKMMRVVYGSFLTEAEAHDTLRKLRANKDFADAWVLQVSKAGNTLTKESN